MQAWPAFNTLTGSPSHSQAIRDILIPAIKGRHEATFTALADLLLVTGDFHGQRASVSNVLYFWNASTPGWQLGPGQVFSSFAMLPGSNVAVGTTARVSAGAANSQTGDYVFDGTAWWMTASDAWSDYTPTLGGTTTNITVTSAKYRVRGRKCIVRATFAIGGALAANSSLQTISLPLTPDGTNRVSQGPAAGGVTFIDSSAGAAGRFAGVITTGSGTSAIINVLAYTTGGAGQFTWLGPTVPFTWASGDSINVEHEFAF